MDEITRLSREEIAAIQARKLRELLTEMLPQNAFWARKFADAGVAIDRIRTPADLACVPLATKSEILSDQHGHPPWGTNLTYPPDRYTRMHQTSGTTAGPMRWLDTLESWSWILECWRQLFRLMGLQKEDRLFFAFSFGPFLGFWAGFEGANRLGNLCVPAGGMSSQARLRLLVETECTVVACTPTYALRLAEVASDLAIDLPKSSVRAILVAGEPGGNIPATRRRIEDAWGARVVDHWGMTELGPLAIEEPECPGTLTLLETECIAEILDPESGHPVAPGNEGELVITNLGRTGSPLIRYRTGDRVRAETAAAPGRNRSSFLRLAGGILGRIDDMITIRGNNIYPSALEDVIRSFAEVAEYRIELRTIKSMQHLKVVIEPATHVDATGTARLSQAISEMIKQRWHFQAEVVIVAPGSLPRFEMKGQRFVRVELP